MRLARPSSVVFTLAMAGLFALAVAVVGMQTGAFSPWFGLVVLAVGPMLGLRTAWRRSRAMRRPLAESDRAWLARHVRLYRQADAAGRRRFERDVLIVLAEARFEGARGAEATPALRLAVAAGVATLLHGRPDWELDLSRTFLFYPDTFDDDYAVEAESDYDGMVHPQGPVLLSARAALEDWEQPHAGTNVVLHELAHLIDFEHPGGDGDADGVPAWLDPASGQAWQRLMRREMTQARLGRSMLGRYAATHPSEFFAVSTERFFEEPDRLAARHPELFEAFAALYGVDPREGTGEPERRGAQEQVSG